MKKWVKDLQIGTSVLVTRTLDMGGKLETFLCEGFVSGITRSTFTVDGVLAVDNKTCRTAFGIEIVEYDDQNEETDKYEDALYRLGLAHEVAKSTVNPIDIPLALTLDQKELSQLHDICETLEAKRNS